MVDGAKRRWAELVLADGFLLSLGRSLEFELVLCQNSADDNLVDFLLAAPRPSAQLSAGLPWPA